MVVSAEFIRKVEIKFLHILSQLFKKGKINIKIAKACIKLFLSFFPVNNYEDFRTKLKIFIDTYPHFSELYLFTLKEIEEAETQEVLEKMRKLMKNKDIDGAINVISQ